MISKGIITIIVDVKYNAQHFDPHSQFQICWYDVGTNALVHDDPGYFDVEPISEEKLRDTENSDQRLSTSEKWKLQATISYETNSIDLHSDHLGIYEFDQNEGCVVRESQVMQVVQIEHIDFVLQASAPSKNRKTKPTPSRVKKPETDVSAGKFIGLAIVLFIFSTIGAGVLTVITMLYLDPINLFLENTGFSLSGTALGKFLPAFLAFGIGSYLGPTLGGRLLQNWGIATPDEIKRVMRVFSKKR